MYEDPDSPNTEEKKKEPEVIKEEDEDYDYGYYDEEEEKKSPSDEGIPIVKAPSGYRVKSVKTSSNASEVVTPAIGLPSEPLYKSASPKSKYGKTLSNPSLGGVKSIEEEKKSSNTSKASTKGKLSFAGLIKLILESKPLLKSDKSAPLNKSVKNPHINPLSIKSDSLSFGSAKNPPTDPSFSVGGSINSTSLSIN
jgi:hypothetical protein